MINFKHFITLAFLLVFFIEAPAQQPSMSFTIKGKILDETTGSPLEFATVALKKMRDSSLVSGTITNATGGFSIESLPPGGFFAEIAFIGYEKHIEKVMLRPQSGSITDIGTIKLSLSVKMLQGAEITAEKSFIMNNIDRKTYNVEQMSVATGGNVNDILQNLPSVELDADGAVSLRGNENVTILIDGRPSGLTGTGGKSLLESLPASAIEKIEVITNPSAKYDPDGISGIINIITKKNKLSGLTGNVNVTSNIDKGYGASASVNYRRGKLNVYSNIGYNYNIRYSKSETYRETFLTEPGGTSFLDQTGEGTNKNKSYNIKAGADYNLTDKTTLSLSGMLGGGSRTGDEFLWYNFYGAGFISDSLYKRTTALKNLDERVDLDLALRKNFSQPGRMLSIQATSSVNSEDNADDYMQQFYINKQVPDLFYLPELQNDDAVEKNNIYTFSADYEHPLSEDKKIEAGVKSILRHIDNGFHSEYFDATANDFVNDLELTNRFVYDDGVHAIYAQYRQSMGKFGIQAGLRSEYAERESELKNTGEKFIKDYFSLFPSAFLSWRPNKDLQFKLNYSRRINRPRTGQLNPFASFEDPLNIRTGNPNLDPEYTDSYELEANRTFKKFSATATLYYRYIHDPVQRYRRFDAATGISNVTFENINSAQNYGLEFILNGNLYKWWSFTLSSNIYQNEIDASNLEANLKSSDIAISSRILTSIKLPYQFDFQLTYSYRAPFETPQGSMKDMRMASLALSKKLMKDKMTATLRVSDPLNDQRFGFDQSGPGYTQEFIRRRDSRTFTVTLGWRFGELKDRDARQKRESLPKEEIDIGM